MQLNLGCSIGCPFCGVSAPKLTSQSQYFSFSDLLKVTAQFATPSFKANNSFLYWASDPFDWHDTVGGRTFHYPDAHAAVAKFGRYKPYVSTAVPSGSEVLIAENQKIVNRISRSPVNAARVEDLRELIGPKMEQALYNVEIDFGLSERTRRLPVLAPAYEAQRAKKDQAGGIGCFNGVLVTPDRFSNIAQLRGSERAKFPERQITVQIDPLALNTQLPRNEQELEALRITRGNASVMEALLQIGVVDHVQMNRPTFGFFYDMVCKVKNANEIGTPIRLKNHTGHQYYILHPNRDPSSNAQPINVFQYAVRAHFAVDTKVNPFYKPDIDAEIKELRNQFFKEIRERESAQSIGTN